MKRLISLFALWSLVACQSGPAHPPAQEDEELDEMSIYHLPSEWTNQHGEKVSFTDMKGNTLVVVMIYTACKTACPRLVADMRHIQQAIPSKENDGIKYIMVSIDPINDTPERLTQFAKDNNMEGAEWLFLQGTEDGTRDFANVLAVKYKKISPIDFSHSNIISVFDRQGVLRYQKEGLGLENDEIIEAIKKTNKAI